MKITIDREGIECAVSEYMTKRGFKVRKVILETSYSSATAEVEIDVDEPEDASHEPLKKDDEEEILI